MQRLTHKRFQKKIQIVCNDDESICTLQNPADLLLLVGMLKGDPDVLLDQLLDLICEDKEVFQLSYVFHSTRYKTFLKVQLQVDPARHIPSLCGLYQSANWLEREVFDLFGIQFDGHPNLKRLLLYPEFAGHPLRKNYPAEKTQPMVPIYA
jgi:NADH-quinone oxidoreductase subunit C